ncbi:MAG: histidine phosphatase family protein [Oscillospiraceae bacterium]
MRAYKLHFIRHGLTQANLEGTYIGQTDLSLSNQGFNNLKDLRKKYSYPSAELVYTSPLKRCVQTAYQLYPEVEMKVVDELSEYNFGDFEGKNYKELMEIPIFLKWLENSKEVAPPNGENSQEFCMRILKGISKIFEHMVGNQIHSAAVVTHSGVITTLLTTIGLPRQEMDQSAVPDGTGFTVLLTPEMWQRSGCFEIFEAIPYRNFDIEDTYTDEQFAHDVMCNYDPEKES